MNKAEASRAVLTRARWRDYLTLCKPRVVALMLLTALVGMHMATHRFVPLDILVFATLGIAFMAGSAGAFNQILDQGIDRKMARTQNRPIVKNKISVAQASIFAFIIGIFGFFILATLVNLLTALLTFCTLMGYAVVYTLFLKHATPQNIVIGGLAGAMPPLLGWTAVTGTFVPESLLLVLIIYAWTPPHFWALAIYRQQDYEKANIPMLPVTHGVPYTKLYILLYTILLCLVSLFPFIAGMSGGLYLLAALCLNARFLYWAIKLLRNERPIIAMQTFRYSIYYLMLLFIFLLIDHYAGDYYVLSSIG